AECVKITSLDPVIAQRHVDCVDDRIPDLCLGTIDTFLIWRLTGGKSFVTDDTNASSTLMYNIAENAWDEDLLDILRVP
ncbi:FGGY family carbohydrate kinase, partial [Rhizobium ruizarguesonis]